MVEFDPYRNRFISALLAPESAGLTDRDFQAYRRAGSCLSRYRFPPVAPRSKGVDRYLDTDLRRLRGGVML